MKVFISTITLLAVLNAAPLYAYDRVYQAPQDFIAEIFPSSPSAELMWLSREVQADVSRILGHPLGQLRQRYWKEGARTLWIMEEIGKEDVITAGFVIKNQRIELARVLVYRESRGMEVRHPAFLKQYVGVALTADQYLDRNIDGISGATLSVHAMGRMARAVLYLDQASRSK